METITLSRREDIKAFQKKVEFKGKTVYEDLMQEQDLAYDSEDNEEVVLDRLQAMYNEPHRLEHLRDWHLVHRD